MKIALFAYSRRGCETACEVMSFYFGDEIEAYAPERFAGSGFAPLPSPARAFYGEIFSRADALIFIGACGIAVREIAPYVRDKRTDPAVVCIDELGRFVIPLLSGHIGGANGLAKEIAKWLNATPVITTATDINGRFSVDAWAAKNGFSIADMRLARAVSAAILERDIPFFSDLPVTGELPEGLLFADRGELGISVSVYEKEPFAKTLRLIPKILRIGIGCKRGTPASAIGEAVQTVLEQNKLDKRAVGRVASIDLKANEEGLLKYCEDNGLKPVFYSAEELRQVPGDFTASEFVKSVTGVDNVCERAALNDAETLLVRKTALNGVTVAVAAEKTEVRFG